MTAHVERLLLFPRGRATPRAAPATERPPSASPLDLERLRPRDRVDLGLPAPALEPERVLARLRLR